MDLNLSPAATLPRSSRSRSLSIVSSFPGQLAEKTRREEAEKAYEKRMDMIVEVRAARAEVISANEAAIEMRNAAERRKKQEVEAILAYQAAKDEEMRLREVAEAEKRAMMKARQQKLLEGQQVLYPLPSRPIVDELSIKLE